MKRLLLAIAFLVVLCAIGAEAQIICVGPNCPSSGGGAAGSITSGTTAIVGGGDTQVCFNDAAFISCGDTGFTFNKTSNVATLLGGVTLGASAANTGVLTLFHASHAFSSSFTVSPTQASGAAYILPTTDGTASQFLQTDGAGLLTWAAAGGGVTVGTTTITSGTDTRIPFNDAGVYGEDAGLTFVKATDTLAVAGGAFLGSANYFGFALSGSLKPAVGSAVSPGAGYGYWQYNTTLTPDGLGFGAGVLSNSIQIFSYDDNAYDFQNACTTGLGTAACTNPTLIIHSAANSTTQALSLAHNGTNGVIRADGGVVFAAATSAHVGGTGTAPAVSACGTTPSTVTGNDMHGRLTTGSGGTVQSCTLTFAAAYAVAPSCWVNNETAIILLRATTTTTTLVIDSAVAGTMESDVITYSCTGN